MTDRSDEEFKFGVNARLRSRSADQFTSSVEPAALPPLALSSAVYGNGINYYMINYYMDHYANGPQIDAATLRAAYAAALASGDVSGGEDIRNNVHDKENVYAQYGQYQFGFGPLGIIAGLRVEETQVTYAGYKDDPTNPTCGICAVSNSKSYTNWFPSAQARYEINSNLIARAAVSSTIARPGFQQVTAATTVDAGRIFFPDPLAASVCRRIGPGCNRNTSCLCRIRSPASRMRRTTPCCPPHPGIPSTPSFCTTAMD